MCHRGMWRSNAACRLPRAQRHALREKRRTVNPPSRANVLQRLVVRIAERKGSDTIEAKHRAVIFPLREVGEPERIASSEEAWVRRPCSHLRSIGPKNQVCSLSRHEPPNESRLSCGAKLECSQPE